MKKTINSFTAAAIALAFVLGSPAAWAGSVASVDQVGDSNYTVVYQKKNKTTTRSWTASNPAQKFVADRKIKSAIKKATRYRPAQRSKVGGCGFGGGLNGTYVAQTGYGNTAFASQTGSNNVAVTSQDGNNNASYIVQKGSGNEAYATQSGNDNVSVIVQRC
jgi:hypothetical protein